MTAINTTVWAEATEIAKSLLNQGKIGVYELAKAVERIYNDTMRLTEIGNEEDQPKKAMSASDKKKMVEFAVDMLRDIVRPTRNIYLERSDKETNKIGNRFKVFMWIGNEYTDITYSVACACGFRFYKESGDLLVFVNSGNVLKHFFNTLSTVVFGNAKRMKYQIS